MRIAVLGLGTAGLTFISEARRIKINAEIVAFEKRGRSVFHPCSIPEALDGRIPPEFLLEPLPVNMKIVKGEVKEVDPFSKTVTFESDGSIGKEKFDFIFVGTGGDTVLPFRDPRLCKATKYEDVVRIKEKLVDAGKIAVVGAGVLGLEIASSLSKYKTVHVYELAKNILPGFLDEMLSQELKEKIELENKNVIFNLGVKVDNPQDIDADLVIFCVGFVANDPLPFHIKVDEFMRVYNPDTLEIFDNIFAAGDCIEYEYKVPRVAPVAAEQARVSARNIKSMIEIGKPVEKYDNSFFPPCILKAFGYEIGRVGKLKNPDRKDTEKFVLDIRILPFADEKLKVAIEVDKDGFVQDVQGISRLRSEVRHLLDIFYIAIKRSIKIDQIRRFELSYQPEICKFPDPITSIAEIVSRRIGLM